MTPNFAQQLWRYRNLLVAIVNAAITWTVLIIAPLGLFAVMLCTGSVFLSTLVVGWVGDLLLLRLLRSAGIELFTVLPREEALGRSSVDVLGTGLPRQGGQRDRSALPRE